MMKPLAGAILGSMTILMAAGPGGSAVAAGINVMSAGAARELIAFLSSAQAVPVYLGKGFVKNC